MSGSGCIKERQLSSAAAARTAYTIADWRANRTSNGSTTNGHRASPLYGLSLPALPLAGNCRRKKGIVASQCLQLERQRDRGCGTSAAMLAAATRNVS